MGRKLNSICGYCGEGFYKRPNQKKGACCSKECGLKMNWINFIKKVEKENNLEFLEDWLINAYTNDMKTYRMIMKELNINNRTVRKLLEHYDIEIRKGSEAISAQWFSEERRNKRRKPNVYIDKGSYFEIKCHDKNGNEKGVIIIDSDDVDKCKKYHWGIDTSGYATTHAPKTDGQDHIKMHRYVIDIPDDKCSDHINRKTNDNRKNNLRICTKLENAWNRKIYDDSKTGYKGVNVTRSNKWYATIGYKCESIHLGTFECLEGAISARKEAELIILW